MVAICDSILYTIGFLIIGLDYAFLIGFCAVFLTIIPYIGAFIICGSAVLLAFVQFGDVTHTLLPLAVFAVVQGIEGFVLQPKILGDKVGLHPLAIIIAVIAGCSGGISGKRRFITGATARAILRASPASCTTCIRPRKNALSATMSVGATYFMPSPLRPMASNRASIR